MNDGLRSEIYQNLDLRETEDLLEIWQTNDKVEWTDLAFEVIREILQQRLGEIPPQNEPLYEHRQKKKSKKILFNQYLEKDATFSYDAIGNSAEIENEKLSYGDEDDDERAPAFYEPLEVARISSWLKKATIPVVIGILIMNLSEFPRLHDIAWSYVRTLSAGRSIAWVIAILFGGVIVAVECFLYYITLRAASSVLRILMEMEFNSRGIKPKTNG